MRVALYGRVSTQRQAQTQSLEQQLERLQLYATQQGWSVPREHVFRDDGYSGAVLKRVLSQSSDRDVLNYHSWLSMQPRHRIALQAFAALLLCSSVAPCEWHA